MNDIIKKVRQANEDTKQVLLGMLEHEVGDKNIEFNPIIETIKLPRQYGKTAMAIGYALTRASECYDDVCIVSWSFNSACSVLQRITDILGCNKNGNRVAYSGGSVCVVNPVYHSLVGNEFDIVIFDESWEKFKEDAEKDTNIKGKNILLGVVKDKGRVLLIETSDEGEDTSTD